jgi:hypothetical protein
MHSLLTPLAQHKQPAQVTFTTGLSEADRAALLAGAADQVGDHLARLLKFVVARAGEPGIFFLFSGGGRGIAAGRQCRRPLCSAAAPPFPHL